MGRKRRQTQFTYGGSTLRTKRACKTVWKADGKCVCPTAVPMLPEQSLGSDGFPVSQLESFSYAGNYTSHFSAPVASGVRHSQRSGATDLPRLAAEARPTDGPLWLSSI